MPAQLLVVRGRVQGVGYRDAAVQAAFDARRDGLGAQSQRRHASRRCVQGDAAAVERFVEWCRRGPPLARVTEGRMPTRRRSGARRASRRADFGHGGPTASAAAFDAEDILPRRVRAPLRSTAARARARCPSSRGRRAAARTIDAELSDQRRGLRANARSTRERAAGPLAVEQRGQRHERERQRHERRRSRTAS